MSPSHRPRLPRRGQDQSARSADPAAEPSTTAAEDARTAGAGTDASGAPGEDARRRLAEIARRNEQEAARDPEEVRRDELERLRRDRERVRESRPAVRVNHPEKVRPEPVGAAEESSGDAGSRSSKSTRPGAGTPAEGASSGGTSRDDAPTRTADRAPASDGTEEDSASPDNVVSFAARRRDAGTGPDRGRRGFLRNRRGSLASTRSPRARRLRRWGLGLLAFVLAAAVFFGVVFWSPLLATRTIEVRGTRLTDEHAIEQSLEPLQGRPLTRITQNDVKQAIGSNIVIQDVTIEAHPPHDLVVTIHERVPVATVQEGGKYVLVDRDGVAIGSVDSAEAAKVPLVQGGLAAVKSSAFTDLVGALQAMPQSLLEQLKSAQAKSETDLELVMKDGSTVRWGTADRNEYKAEVLQALIKATGQGGSSTVYDVSSPDHPVTRTS